MRDVFTSTVRQLGISILQCDGVADTDLAYLSITLGLPVISGDYDYVVYGVMLIPLHTLAYGAPVQQEEEGHDLYLTCSMFSVDTFIQVSVVGDRR